MFLMYWLDFFLRGNMRNIFFGGLVCLLMAACASIQPKFVDVSVRFDAEAAREQMKDGKNTIKGSAFLRQNGGGVVTCAGYPVNIVPDTEYARARMRVNYDSTEHGFLDANQARFGRHSIVSKNVPVEYVHLMRKSKCDAMGNFAFEDVGDGK